ncbi:MAG: DUF2442 domain-containing protein [Thermoguttaceae bacterium]
MSTLPIAHEPCATNISFAGGMLKIDITDGRELSVPLVWFPKLAEATSQQRGDWRFIGAGEGIHWNELDEDISILKLFGHAD